MDVRDQEAQESGAPPAAAAARARLSRPTSSQLLAQRAAEQGDNGRPRSTRVIPALAARQASEFPPVPDAPAAAPAASTAPAAPDGDAPPSSPSPASSPSAVPVEPSEYPPDLVFIVRADGTVLYVNRPLGPRGEEDVIGSELYDWVFPEQHATVRATLERVFGSGESAGLELSGIQNHQADAWYECRIAPNHRDGKVVSATIIARDVTRYKRAEQALRAAHDELRRLAEERAADIDQLKKELARRPAERDRAQADADRFRTLLDAAGEAVFVTDPSTGTVVDVNETACRWLRTARDRLRGRPVVDLRLEFPVLLPGSLDAELTETRDTRRPLILEGVHRRRDGSTFPVEVAVAAHQVGEREYVLAVARDVKGRRRVEDALTESEHRYRSLVEQSFDAVFLTTRGGAVVEANEAALALFGYEDGGFVGVDARTLLPRPDDVRRFQRAMAEQGIVRHLEVELRRRNGETFAGFVSATARRDAQERLQGYQWVARPAPEAQTAAPPPAPATEAGLHTGDVLLVVEGDARSLADSRDAVRRLGVPVLTAQTASEAVQVFRAHTPRIPLAILGPVRDSTPDELARSLRTVFPGLRVILATPEDPFAVLERSADLAVEACLRHPVHPLALVQSVREALGGLPGA